MRVTHVITRLIVGGAQENTIATVRGLHARFGQSIRLVAGPSPGPEGSLEPSLADLPAVLTLVPSLVRPVHPWNDLLTLVRLANIFRQQRPEIVHTHSGKAGVLGRLAARRAAVPVVVHTIHGPSFGRFQGPLPNQLFLAAERLAAKCTTHFVSVADAMTRQYLAAGLGEPGRFTRIFSGFAVDDFCRATNDPAERARWGLKPDDFVVGKIARLFKLKGHDDLFRVAPRVIAACPRVKFLLVGDGAWRARFEAQARRQQLDRHFVLTGLIPPAQIPRLVGIMDVVVHLSRREGLPRALPQALAAARPVIACDCDGASEVCVTGTTGFLVPPGDLEQLATRLIQLAGDAELRRRLGQQGQQFVRQHFRVETMIDAHQQLYERLMPRIGGSLDATEPCAKMEVPSRSDG